MGGLHVGGVRLLHELPEDDRLLEVAALLEEAGQGPVEGRVLRVLLPGLVEGEDGEVEEPEGVERLGHVHLRAHVPRVAAEDLLAVFEDLEVVAAALGGLDAAPSTAGGQEREPAAAEVVAELVLLGLAQRLAVKEVAGVEPAAGEEQLRWRSRADRRRWPRAPW